MRIEKKHSFNKLDLLSILTTNACTALQHKAPKNTAVSAAVGFHNGFLNSLELIS